MQQLVPVTPLRCPGCHAAMQPEESHGTQLDRCPNCPAIWFDASELDDALGPAPHPTERTIPIRGVGGHSCPRCWPQQLETAGWSGLVLDRCPHCHGWFVEASRLRRLRDEGVPRPGIESHLTALLVAAGWDLLAVDGIVQLLVHVL